MWNGIKYKAGVLLDEAKFATTVAFGDEDRQAYCAAIMRLSEHTKLDRRTIQKWFDSAVADSGMPWKKVYDRVVIALTDGYSLSDTYQQVIGMQDNEQT